MANLEDEVRDLRSKVTLMEQALGRATFDLFMRAQLRAACANVVLALTLPDPEEAIKFYTNVLGATEGFRVKDGKGKVAHAALQIGDSQVFINSEYPEIGLVSPAKAKAGGAGIKIHVFVSDAKAAHKRALKAGCKEITGPKEEFWGETRATVADPYGYQWVLSTNKAPVPVNEIARRADKEFGRSKG